MEIPESRALGDFELGLFKYYHLMSTNFNNIIIIKKKLVKLTYAVFNYN